MFFLLFILHFFVFSRFPFKGCPRWGRGFVRDWSLCYNIIYHYWSHYHKTNHFTTTFGLLWQITLYRWVDHCNMTTLLVTTLVSVWVGCRRRRHVTSTAAAVAVAGATAEPGQLFHCQPSVVWTEANCSHIPGRGKLALFIWVLIMAASLPVINCHKHPVIGKKLTSALWITFFMWYLLAVWPSTDRSLQVVPKYEKLCLLLCDCLYIELYILFKLLFLFIYFFLGGMGW